LPFLPQFAFVAATLFFPNPETMVSDLAQSLKALEARYSPCKRAKTMARNFFENHQELFQKGKKQSKTADFLRNFKYRHNLLLDLSGRSHENLSCNVLLLDIPSVVRELSLKNRRARR